MHKGTKSFCKKVFVGALSTLLVVSGLSFPSVKVKAAGNYNYGDALAKSLLFYQLQESGKLSEETLSRTNWRADSCLHDGQDNGLDLTGGWYDAGDNVKFNLPMAYSSMILGWSYLNNPEAYSQSGQAKWMLHDIMWANDYFVKCNPDSSTYYYQVGDGGKDHGFWGAPELVEAKMDRPSYKVGDTPANGGSCVTGEAAASLAVASIILKDIDPARSATYIEHAKTLYGMAERAKSDEGYTAASGFYTSFSGFYDELSLAGCWLYKATGDETYLEKAEEYTQYFGTEFQGGTEMAYSWTMSWDDTHMAACLLLAELTGEDKYYTAIENSIDCWNGKLPGSNPITISPGGLSFLSQWGSLRYANNQAFIDTIYVGLDKADAQHIEDANKYIERTVNYTLGSSGQNFMVGYNSESPKNPHHRAAHGCWSNNLNAEPATSRHTLVGAVVGGPNAANDSYKDDRSDYIANEVACDYNAGFTGACAYMYEKNGFGAVTTPTAIEQTDGAEFVLKAGINAQDSNNKINFVEIKTVIENHTAWPARVTDNLTLRLFFDLSDVLAQGYSASDMKISTTYQQHKAQISEFKETDKAGIYYVDVNLAGADIYPGGQSECKCELQIRFTAPGKWDFTNSPCVKGLGGTSNNQMTAPSGMQLFEDGNLVLGEGFVAPDPVVDPTPVEPDPTPVDPDPTPVDPDPTPVDPDPTPVDPDPTPVDPDPTPVDPTPTPSGDVRAEYSINNWGSGYQVLISVKNDSDSRINSWTLKVNKNDVEIDSSWCVNVKEEGNYYVITPMSWNASLDASGSTDFGIQGSEHISDSIEMIVESN
jgi:cell division septation protein DedD